MMSLKRDPEDPGEKEESLGRLISWEHSSAAQGTKVARKLGEPLTFDSSFPPP